ncbi:hypothetical protein [Cellulomonas sp.]|uniref:hypothetical protein n=1 Tax=Cellulomonas sp. TaxID=40001 RepID=UPI003BAB6A81
MPTEPRTAPRRARLRPRGPLAAVPTAAVAAVTLVVAFVVAQATDVRALGGALLVAGVAWCVWRSVHAAGWLRVAAVVLVGAVCFVGAHLLSPAFGPWPAVLLAALGLGAVAWVLTDTRS